MRVFVGRKALQVRCKRPSTCMWRKRRSPCSSDACLGMRATRRCKLSLASYEPERCGNPGLRGQQASYDGANLVELHVCGGPKFAHVWGERLSTRIKRQALHEWLCMSEAKGSPRWCCERLSMCVLGGYPRQWGGRSPRKTVQVFRVTRSACLRGERLSLSAE